MEIADDARIDCSDDTLELVEDMYTACDETHAEGFAGYFGEGARFRWGNLDPVEGPGRIASFVGRFFEDIQTLDHTFTGIYEADVADVADGGDRVATIILESVVTYTVQNSSEVDVPATTALDVDASNAVVGARVYVDTSPVYET